MPRFVIRPILFVFAVGMLANCGPANFPRCPEPTVREVRAESIVETARAAWERLDHPKPEVRAEAHEVYHSAVVELFGRLRCGTGGWQAAAAELGTLIAPGDADRIHPASLDGVGLAADVSTESVGGRHRIGDFGVPLVGWRRPDDAAPAFAPPDGTSYALCAVLRFEADGPPVWHFHRMSGTDRVTVGSSSRRLAFDPSARDALYWDRTTLESLALLNVFRPGRFGTGESLFFMQPYDPEKIPLVLVHGLQSSPFTFRKLANAVAADPDLRDRYQVWFYSYATGYPWSFSAVAFRQRMREASAFARSQGGAETVDQMVIVAHSMGGLLTRASVSEPGSTLYRARFSKPIEELVLPENGGDLFQEYFFYEPLQDPSRVVFLAVPHRGSPMTERYIAHLLTRLIRLPITLTSLALQVATLNVEAIAATGRDQLPTGIDSLSPHASPIRALQVMPLRAGLEVHSVVGDIGLAAGRRSGTDGVVPYWSAHFPRSASERVVAANHSLTGDPATIAEVLRILRLHLRSSR